MPGTPINQLKGQLPRARVPRSHPSKQPLSAQRCHPVDLYNSACFSTILFPNPTRNSLGSLVPNKPSFYPWSSLVVSLCLYSQLGWSIKSCFNCSSAFLDQSSSLPYSSRKQQSQNCQSNTLFLGTNFCLSYC